MIYDIKNLIANTDTTKATTNPTTNNISSFPVKLNPNLSSFNALAPNITGIARKNVNSAATVLDTPINNAPTIVAPEREVPGNTAAISCYIPKIIAVVYVISAKLLIVGLLPLL